MEVLLVPADAGRPDGPEVVRKTASLPGERQRLLREAEVLEAAAERGVPGLATVVGRPSAEAAEPCLITSAVAGPSLAAAAPLPVLEVAGVAAEVARLLAGLHESGLVHGAVEPGHVVLDGAGGAILVGLGRGGATAAPSAAPAAERLDPATDVAGWGALVGHLLDWSATTDDEPLVALRRALVTRPARRRGRRQPQAPSDHDERRVLAALADQAQDPDPARRPSARSLAAAVRHRIPAARMPGGVAVGPPVPTRSGLLDRLAAHISNGSPAGSASPAKPVEGSSTPVPDGPDPAGGRGRDRPPLPPRRRDRERRPTAAGARGPAPSSAPAPADGIPASSGPEDAPAGELPAASRRRSVRPSPRPPRWVLTCAVLVVAVLGASATVARLRTTGPPDTTGPPGPDRRCPPIDPPSADVDGNGCDEPVRWVDGVLQAGSARFALGGPGDAWAVGDWDCDGRRTPALLHDGTLSVFDDWPALGGELRGRPVAAPAGATLLAVVREPDGCERPSLGRAGATEVVVDPRSVP